jgi:DNA-binding response OmpR family regulator
MPMGDIMILEDEVLIALDLEMTLQAAGHDATHVFSDDESASRYLADRKPCLGLLDLNLGGGRTSIPVARTLAATGVPFLFLTGEERDTLTVPPDLADRPRLYKPFSERELLDAMAPFLADRGPSPSRCAAALASQEP